MLRDVSILSRPATRTLLIWLGLCFLPAVNAIAQRELHWDSLEVTARLNADGTLDVAETQTIVFTGDWNGGERKFNIRPRQRLSLTGVYRGGPGGWQALTEDSSLDDVDEYGWADERTLRWRSRRASDPPFAATTIRYELRYVLSGILLKEDERYRLDHDFAFADRTGTIERFALRLTVDPAWQPMSELRPLYTAGPLAADTSFVLTLPLHYTGLGIPAALDLARAPAIVGGVWTVLGVTTLAVLWFFVREQRYGRFAPLPQPVDEPWLREHILKYPAEVVAAAWDENVGTAEVVALIARMVGDGKLESSVGTGASMTLRLKVDRSTLQGHERTLVEKLFFDGRTETSTSAVRAHYRAAGFNPAGEIEPELQTAVDRTLSAGRAPRRFKAIAAVLFALGTGLLVVRGFQGYPIVALPMMAIVVLAVIGWIAGHQFRAYLDWGRGAALLCLIPALAIAASVSLYLWFYAGTGAVELDRFSVLGIVAIAIACVHSTINSLKSRRSREAIAFRKALTAGRAFFIQELGKERPALSDEWYPWMLAFELGKQVDAWSTQRAGGETRGRSSASSAATSASSEAQWTGFGGGKSGGGGGGASWQAAAGGMAAAVSPPSSSGSGGSSRSSGGSSSGGSSGGGGGGGW